MLRERDSTGKSKFFLLIFLAIFVISSSLSYSQRKIRLKVAVDEEFRRYNNTWQLYLKRLINDATQVLEEKFGLIFEIETWEPWASDNTLDDMISLLQDLKKKVSREESDAIIGFTAQRNIQRDLLGIAYYSTSHILIKRLASEPYTESIMKNTLMHELCHLFGAVDLNEPGSIMDKEKPGANFDEFTSRIIHLHKDRSFNPFVFPLPEEKIKEAQKPISLLKGKI